MGKTTKITIIGPAYPYRGGIALFDEMLAQTFSARGEDVEIVTFTLQYPEFLFPGKTQFSESAPPEGLKIEREINSVNPFNWIKVGRKVARAKPDMVIMKYWTPFMAPCLGTIARLIRKNKHTKVIVQVDNVTPHEHHITDRTFNSYFMNSVDGFVYMSREVGDDISSFRRDVPSLFSPHPIYMGYGKGVDKKQACEKLGIDAGFEYSLFFGLIRDYKGLDMLLDAWRIVKEKGGGDGRKLIVAGEFYADKEKYLELIKSNGLEEEVILHDFFVRDEDVKFYFSAADVLIQPYWTATQSGVTQIAYNFDLPMIVTNVGGLAEIVPDDVVGYVTETTPESVANAIIRFYTADNAARFRANMELEKKRFSWDAMADKIMEAYELAQIKS